MKTTGLFQLEPIGSHTCFMFCINSIQLLLLFNRVNVRSLDSGLLVPSPYCTSLKGLVGL